MEVRSAEEYRTMTPQEKQHLTRIVERHKAINAQIQDLKWEAKELAESAWDKCGVRPKVVKQLAKEAAWDNVQREEQRQHEESLDDCRAALGLLAETPLGQAAQQSHVPEPAVRADGTLNGSTRAANGANGANGHAETRRGPGRPRGSRNKAKPANRSDRADYAAPPVPDLPDAA
jgi:hypothetical protein